MDGAAYIMKLPKAEQGLAEWQAAGEALIMAAENRGPLMHARVGVLRALNRTHGVEIRSDLSEINGLGVPCTIRVPSGPDIKLWPVKRIGALPSVGVYDG
jgi:hypothetical protein